MVLRRFLLVPVLALVGCASSAADDPSSGDTQDLTAATSYYDCYSSFSDDQLKHFELGLGDGTLSVTDLSKDALPPDTGSYDASYRPTATYAGYVRYSGFDKLVSTFSDLGSIDFLASKELQDRAPKGTVAIRGQGPEGGGTSRANCSAKAKPVSVDVGRKARLACSLRKLICTDDNPPGSTCLGDLFVNQTSATSATIKLTYLDHFGVHVAERPVSLGASSSLARTDKHADLAWADGTKMSLNLRAGVTYTGTFTDAHGASGEVQCNDLAMLDP